MRNQHSLQNIAPKHQATTTAQGQHAIAHSVAEGEESHDGLGAENDEEIAGERATVDAFKPSVSIENAHATTAKFMSLPEVSGVRRVHHCMLHAANLVARHWSKNRFRHHQDLISAVLKFSGWLSCPMRSRRAQESIESQVGARNDDGAFERKAREMLCLRQKLGWRDEIFGDELQTWTPGRQQDYIITTNRLKRTSKRRSQRML